MGRRLACEPGGPLRHHYRRRPRVPIPGFSVTAMLRLPNRMACLLIAAAAACGPAAAADDGRADVRIVQQGPVFVIDATLHAPVVPELAWQVLTDFERMETFVPNLADSRIVARDGPHVTILQHGIARF